MRLYAIGMFILFSLTCHNLMATTLLYKDFNALIDEADNVVVGVVESVSAVRNDKTDDIYSIVRLSDVKTIDSNGANLLNSPALIRIKGGAIDILGDNGQVEGQELQLVHGAPEFSVGDHVVLFTKNNGISSVPFVGWSQGVFWIGKDNSVRDSENRNVVGLQDGHLVLSTKQGLQIAGKAIQRMKETNLQSETPILVKSDGGHDALVKPEEVAVESQKITRDLNAMDISNFLSMIQERKASRQAKTTDHSSLIELPPLSKKAEHPDSRPSQMTTKHEILQKPVEMTSESFLPAKPEPRKTFSAE